MERQAILGQAEVRGHRISSKKLGLLMAAGIVVLTICIVTPVVLIKPSGSVPADDFAGQVVASQAAYTHLDYLAQTAAINGSNSRSIATNYIYSIGYVQQAIEAAGGAARFNATVDYFVSPYWRLLNESASASILTIGNTYSFTNGYDFRVLRYSGAGNPTSTITHVKDSCTAADYTAANGTIVLLQAVSGLADCDLYTRAMLAEAAGAVGLIAYATKASDGILWPRVRASDWDVSMPFTTLPSVGVTSTVAQILLDTTEAVTLFVAAMSTHVPSANLIVDTLDGDPANTLVVGAHLDSVDAGPGVNDNGSGSAAVLAMVSVMGAKNMKPRNRIRFCWWGAEEEGLIGSRSYLRKLNATDPAEFQRLKANLNFDMLASPNAVHLVYDGMTAPPSSRAGSVQLQKLFETFFNRSQVKYKIQPFSTTGGSDYFPFIHSGQCFCYAGVTVKSRRCSHLNDRDLTGIPAGSIATGAGTEKTPMERDTYGGTANAAYDTCYHQSCDTLQNINKNVYDVQLAAASFAVWHLADLPTLGALRQA
ncbi:uncharacterized protein MONBRDRAFT_35713 [Monosiga brevicollis MX1]|uniref:Peptidase M28 domain-containing protein n=1 Tax=Monosiga brevicollis TaxID=81824 RepID=A9UQW2_MONBE|nr:uncharacterized protein MONBRDRAFT_35713 [Monosiga brevicollis MX1]EDQ92668.1 predicted protein [Monosiga brevicollis MX1]|eukprot:XP_001742430.1 hypothetical protein [Monosiga brevicollis MX1]